MLHLAVLLSGLGGLLVELVLVRRFGLLIGNTSVASAFVIGAYLLGLGIGGLVVHRLLQGTRRPLSVAAGLYGAVALVAWLADLGVRTLSPPPFWAGIGLLALTPGIPTLLMGMAFPLIFSGLGSRASRLRVGALNAANLAGSLVATAFGDNVWIPEYGLRATVGVGCLAYLGAAACVFVASRSAVEVEPLPRGRGARLGSRALVAALSGASLVGWQIYLLRRMPFILEGFQPTLSGVLAACLVGLALGSAIATPILGRVFRERAPEASVLLATLLVGAGLTEHAATAAAMAMWPIESTFMLHARIWVAAGIAAIPIGLMLGATVPLCIAEHDEAGARSAAAGRLFFWQGVGSIVGSLTVSQLLTRAFPDGFFVYAPLLLGVVPALLLVRLVPRTWSLGAVAVAVVASFAGLSGIGTPLAPEAPLSRPGSHVAQEFAHLAHHTDSGVTASVAWDPDAHRMLLYTNEFAAAGRGPAGDYMRALGHLPFLLRDEVERTAVIAFGTGTTARSVAEWPIPKQIELVEISRSVIAVSGYFAADGPLYEPRPPAFMVDPRTVVRLDDGRRYLAEQEAGSLDLVTMEPLLAYSPGTTALYTREFYAQAARALSDDGLLVQWIPTHALPPRYYVSLLASFARSFPHHSLWILDGQSLLVGSRTPHLPTRAQFERRLRSAPEAAAASMHEARIADWDDFRLAFTSHAVLDVVGDAPDVSDDRPFTESLGVWKYDGSARDFLADNYRAFIEPLIAAGVHTDYHEADVKTARMHRTVGYRIGSTRLPAQKKTDLMVRGARRLARARTLFPYSSLLHHEETLARRKWLRVLVNENGAGGVRDLAIAHLERDPGAAFLHAALGALGVSPAEEAAVRADAISPSWTDNAPRDFAAVAEHSRRTSPLFEVADLPVGEALAVAATGDDPMAFALRGAYGVRVARAFCEKLRHRPLDAAENEALRVVLDPEALRLARAAIAARGGDVEAELAPLLRSDLRD